MILFTTFRLHSQNYVTHVLFNDKMNFPFRKYISVTGYFELPLKYTGHIWSKLYGYETGIFLCNFVNMLVNYLLTLQLSD